MAGTKGHSGRRTHYDDKLVSELVNMSVKTCRDYLQDPSIPKKDKAELARHFAVKAIPNIIQGDPDFPVFQLVNFGDIKSNNE